VADLTVIVVSANSGRWLRPCLASVFARAGDASLDVVVVDAECTDDTATATAEFPAARLLRVENHGFAYGNNRAFLMATAPYVLFLNPDTEILSGSFGELVAELDRRPEVGLVGVRQLTPDGELWPTIRRFPSPLRHLFESLGSEHLPWRCSWLGERELDLEAYERDTPCDWTSGSFMLARREAVLAAGLMDERFFIYCEEPDLCLRIKRAGWEVRHLPAMTILHHAGRSGYAAQFIAQEAFARRQYMEKHFPPVRRAAGIAAYALGYALRGLLGGRRRTLAAEQRRASRAALAVLLRNGPPPFAPPPAHALAPDGWSRS
jgi:N-acetylglucosaminyl-diphospho-decaprenol L-rhamnosyltransferase